MKKLILILALFATFGSLPACKTTLEDDKVTIEDNDKSHGNKHCPPGQAKKGWC